MSIALPSKTQALKEASARFVTDSAGRTLFYPNGPMRRGFVVTSTEIERALRDAAKQLNAIRGYATPFFVALIAPCFYWFVGSHPLLTFGLLFPALIAFGALADWVVQRIALGSLLEGLESIPPQEPSLLRNVRWINACPLAGVPVLAWLIDHIYDQRIATIAGDGSVRYFYGDLSWPILLTVMGCVLPAILVFNRRFFIEKGLGELRLTLSALLLGALGVGGLIWGTALFLHPTPNVALTNDALICSLRANWNDIAKMEIQSGSRGSEWLRVEFSDSRRRPATCKITGLNVDYRTVYDAINASWIAHRSEKPAAGAPQTGEGPQSATAGLPPTDATKEQVRAILGKPTLDDGDAYYYFSFPIQAKDAAAAGAPSPDRRIIAVYFDERKRVYQAIEFGLREGHVFDYTNNQAVNPQRWDFRTLYSFLILL